MFIKVGCCGFPVGRAQYFEKFPTVEIDSSFYNLPQLATVERWRQEAPKGFEFSMKAWQLITHLSSSPTYRKLTSRMTKKSLAHCGHFHSTPEVASAWDGTRAMAQVLGAKFILFQTPISFFPNADHLRDMYRFFKGVRRLEGVSMVWEPRGDAWSGKMVRKVCGELGLIHGVDPMAAVPAYGTVQYFRLHGKYEGGRLIYSHNYSDAELRHLLERCGNKATYVFFNNTSMWFDAQRFNALVDPLAPARAAMSRQRRARVF